MCADRLSWNIPSVGCLTSKQHDLGTWFSVRPQRITHSGRTTSTALPCNSPRRWRRQQSSRTTGMAKSRWLVRSHQVWKRRTASGRSEDEARSARDVVESAPAVRPRKQRAEKQQGSSELEESGSSGNQWRSFTEMSEEPSCVGHEIHLRWDASKCAQLRTSSRLLHLPAISCCQRRRRSCANGVFTDAFDGSVIRNCCAYHVQMSTRARLGGVRVIS